MDHSNGAGSLQIQIFVGQWGPREQEMLSRWHGLADEYDVRLDVQIIELFDAPDLARKFNIVCTPTSIISCADEQSLRCVGFNEKIDRFIRHHAMHRRATKLHHVTNTMYVDTLNMMRESKAVLETNKRRQETKKSKLPDGE